MNRHLFPAVLAALASFLCPTASAAPNVVATITPIHSLVAAVMQGVGEPSLIVRGTASPHHYQLRPSDAVKLENARVIFWVGGSFETFLRKPLNILGQKARVVTLMQRQEIKLLRNRRGGVWEDHNGQHDEHAGHAERETESERNRFDAHLWLDPENAKKIADLIATELGTVDPANAVTYNSNSERLKHRIEMLDLKLAKRLDPIRDMPYVVFHDAYQYLERHYGLNAVGSITVGPEQRPSARRLTALRAKINELGARCIFSEPQFEPALVKTMIEGTRARRGTLDPLGSAFRPGPDAYFDMMNANVSTIVDCLSKK